MAFALVLEEIRSNMERILEGMGVSGIRYAVEPAKPGFGDATCNVSFLLSKRLKKAPGEIAERISGMYRDAAAGGGGGGGHLVSGVEAHPSGYLNFTADMNALGAIILGESARDDYGTVDVGGSARVVVEHTSVNPNKALHIGHVRNVVIGDTVSRILRKANHDVRVLNYVDDSGLQVADIVLGFRELGFSEEPPADTKFDRYCGDHVYVRTTEMYAERPELERTRRDILKEIEGGVSETAVFAGRVTGRVLAEQLRTCWRLSASYDCLNFESQIVRSGLWGAIFEKLKSMNLVEFEDGGTNAGCWVIRGGNNGAGNNGGAGDADGRTEDKVIVRSNGTATYVAKDIPYAAWKLGLVDDPFGYVRYGQDQPGGRTLWQTTLDGTGTKKEFRGDRVITVVDSRQLRLQNIVRTLMDRFKSSEGAYVHLAYESVTLSPGTARTLGVGTGGRQAQMSGRRGVYVGADTVYDMLVEKSSAETKKRNPDMTGPEILDVARAVSVGTLRYEMIRQDLDRIISFDLERSLSLEGDTAPYLQYAHARAHRILERAGALRGTGAGGRPASGSPSAVLPASFPQNEYERGLLVQIGLFGNAVEDSARNLSPKVVARYCRDLAVGFNSLYEHVRILDSDDDAGLAGARILLVSSFCDTLAKALSLLGIPALERM